MSFQIDRGLFKFDFTDHHAVLGVPVDADPEQIRQRYKQIARRLHPDSNQSSTQAEKALAVQLFSKLVSPAYSLLSKEKPRAEHLIILGHMGKRLISDAQNVQIVNESAKQLAQVNNVDQAYKTSVQNLAATQYESLGQALEAIATLSELNMVYLMRKEGEGLRKTTASKTFTPTPTKTSNETEKQPVEPAKVSPVDPYLRRAEDHIAKNNLAKAVLELRDALNAAPNNSTCHSLLGLVYLKQNQPTMAKIHINKALQLNPQDPKALQAKKILEKVAPTAGDKPPEKSGGLFGGLFGGKKK